MDTKKHCCHSNRNDTAGGRGGGGEGLLVNQVTFTYLIASPEKPAALEDSKWHLLLSLQK